MSARSLINAAALVLGLAIGWCCSADRVVMVLEWRLSRASLT